MKKKLFIIGLPNAGKTTFLAAMWCSLNQRLVNTKLKLVKIIGDVQYLFAISKKWEQVEKLERTAIGQEKQAMTIFLGNSEMEFELEFPDMSGETFQHICSHRVIDRDVKERIKEADSVMYFVNIEDIKKPYFLCDIPKEFRVEKGADNVRDAQEHNPTQVQIIELLQVVLGVKTSKFNLGIILSAWDLLEDTSISPDDYLRDNMNMLWQFLQANEKQFSTHVWGVSALGGKIGDVEKILEHDNSIDRIIIQNKDERTNDLTTIISEMARDIYD